MTGADLKSAAKPTVYRRQDDEWPGCSFTVRAHLGITSDLVSCLKYGSVSAAAKIVQVEAVKKPGMPEQERQSHQLVMSCWCPALGVLLAVERNNDTKCGDNSSRDTNRTLAHVLLNKVTRMYKSGDFSESVHCFESALVPSRNGKR